MHCAGQILVELSDTVETLYTVYETQEWIGLMVVSVWVSSLEILNIHVIGYRLNRITVTSRKARDTQFSSGAQWLIFPPKNISEPIN